MKKMKNILFIFIALFVFFVVVDNVNAETLKEEAIFKYSTNINDVVYDAKEVEEGIVLVGSRILSETNEYAYIVLLNEKGVVTWDVEYKIDDGRTDFWDVIPLKDYLLVSASSYITSGEETVRDDYILIYNYDGTFVKRIDFETDDFGMNVIGYGNYYGVMLGETGGFKLYKASDNSLVGSVAEGVDTNSFMNDEGIYITETSYKTGETTLSLYDYSLKKIKSNTIHKSGINKDTNKYTDAFFNYRFIITDNYIYCVGVTEGYGEYTDVYTIYSIKKSDFSVIKSIEYKVGTIETISAYKDYLIAGVFKNCSDNPSCDILKNPVVVFDNNLNIKAAKEVDYEIRGIIGNGIYIVGDNRYEGYKADNYDVFITKFKYDLGVEISSVKNGEVYVENIDNVDGTTTIKLNITPEKGYVVKSIVVKDATGKTIEVNDNSFVKPDADVIVEIIFDKEVVTNPNTGLSNPFMICGIAFVVAGICYCFLMKKKYL